MTDKNTELEELEREIRKIIDDNRKFLSRVLDDDFEPEEEATEEPELEV